MSRATKAHRLWRRSHNTKRTYPSVWAARKSIWRVMLRDRKWKHVHLHTYQCRWGRDWRAGESYPVHTHIGHTSKKWRRKNRRGRRTIMKRYVIWPYYRLRRATRSYLSSKPGSWSVAALIKIDDLAHHVRLARPLGLCWLLDEVLFYPVQERPEKYLAGRDDG